MNDAAAWCNKDKYIIFSQSSNTCASWSDNVQQKGWWWSLMLLYDSAAVMLSNNQYECQCLQANVLYAINKPTRVAPARGPTDRISTFDHDFWPFTFDLDLQCQESCGHDSYICKRSRSKVAQFKRHRVKTNGRTDGGDCITWLVNAVVTRSSANVEGPREHAVSWNRVKCGKNGRRKAQPVNDYQSRSRSLTLVPFDRPRMIYY